MVHNKIDKYLKEDYENFKETVENFISYKYFDDRSFIGGYYLQENPEAEVKKLYVYLIKKGINLYDKMSKYKKQILKDDYFTTTNGFLDFLLYSTYKTFPLTGGKLKDYDENSEVMYKYYYGYQNTYLGLKYINQSYENLDDFYYDLATSYFPEYVIIELNLGDVEIKNSEKHNGFSISKFYLPFKNSDAVKNIQFMDKIEYKLGDSEMMCVFGDDDIVKNIENFRDMFSLVDEYVMFEDIFRFGL